MQQLGNLTINQLAELETANFMYKYLHNELPIVFNGLLDKNTISEKTYDVRSQSKLFPLFRRIELTKQSMKYRGPRTWNAIPMSVRESKSLKSLNKLTKAHLISLKWLLLFLKLIIRMQSRPLSAVCFCMLQIKKFLKS